MVTELNELLRMSVTYADPNDLQVRRLLKAADKLKSADAIAGWMTCGMLSALVGDRGAARAAFQNAEKIGASAAVFYRNWLTALVNLGEVSSAHALIRRIGHPENGYLPEIFDFAVQIGAVNSILAQARKSRDVLGSSQVSQREFERAEAISSVMAELELSDELVAAHLDAAGEVTHKAGIMSARWYVAFTQDPPEVLFSIVTDASTDLISLNGQLGELQVDKGLKISPEFDVVIV